MSSNYIQERDNCVICNGSLSYLYNIADMPASLSVTQTEYATDMFVNQCIYTCNKCSCPQLKMLVDPNILYGTAHNLTHKLPTWSNHHEQFGEFITLTNEYDSIMEIGGSSGALYEILKTIAQTQQQTLNYSCIDLCAAQYDTSNVNYIVDNCETYQFKNTPCLVLSHVFEHLYSPIKFINNMAKSNVKTVYISIPNMEKLLENDSCSVLHFEHTYYVDRYYAEYLFSRGGYKLTEYKEFMNHSLFMKFEKADCPVILLNPREYIPKSLSEIYKNMIHRFTTYAVHDGPSFIIPAGHMGQLVYTMTTSKNIIGFLDNDISKHNKRLYGTPHTIFSFNKLNDYDTCTVYIYAGPYLNELLIQLKSYGHVKVIVL